MSTNGARKLELDIFTDGAVKDNGKPTAVAGWGFVILLDGELLVEKNGRLLTELDADQEDWQSNNTGEMTAVIEALKALPYPCEVRVTSDSAYVINCFKDKWYEGWIRRDWFKSDGNPVKNRKLWEPLLEQHSIHKIEWVHVRGHQGNEWNEYCDGLAKDGVLGNMREYKHPDIEKIFNDYVPMHVKAEDITFVEEDDMEVDF